MGLRSDRLARRRTRERAAATLLTATIFMTALILGLLLFAPPLTYEEYTARQRASPAADVPTSLPVCPLEHQTAPP